MMKTDSKKLNHLSAILSYVYYQVKVGCFNLCKHVCWQAQKLLDEIVEKNLEIVRDPANIPDNNVALDECGIRLFKNAPLGIVFDHMGK